MIEHDLLILYGSETGNAEEIAFRIKRESVRRHKKPLLLICDEYLLSNLINEKFVVFVVSTTGQGDPPNNMKKFWKFIWRKVLPHDSLTGVEYAVIGLGDSSYQKYNMVGRKLFRRLKQLGAKPFVDCCLGDDQHAYGYNTILDPWLIDFWTKYLNEYPIDEGLKIISNHKLLPTRFELNFIENFETTSTSIKNGVITTAVPSPTTLESSVMATATTATSSSATAIKTMLTTSQLPTSTMTTTSKTTTSQQPTTTLQQQPSSTITKTSTTTTTSQQPTSTTTSSQHPTSRTARITSTTTTTFQQPTSTTTTITATTTFQQPTSTAPTPILCRVKSNTRMTSADHWQDVRLITLRSLNEDFKYDSGDVCMIKPFNSEDNVSEFLQLMNFDPNSSFLWKAREAADHLNLPQPCQIGWLVRHYLDITSIPKSYFWEVVARVSNDDDDVESKLGSNIGEDGKKVVFNGKEVVDDGDFDERLSLEREKLEEFCTVEGQEELYSYCNRPRRNILEVLNDFPCSRKFLSLARLLDIIPPIRERAFSISSAPSKSTKEIEVLVAVVEYKTKLKKVRKGLCSTYLADRIPGDVMEVSLEKGGFVTPSLDKPLIMIGPGTGCSVFRSFIQQRMAMNVKENYLFFGCRNRTKDYFFKDEWERLVGDGYLHLFVAFSRDQEHKVYVQHVLKDNGSLLWNLISAEEACILISGNSKNMPDSVRDAFVNIFIEHGGFNLSQAETYIHKLAGEFRFQLETWS